ncbi:MAG: hypothetical protein ACRERE_35360 [Candidatus Entotheonellia bacterium]
MQWTRQAFFEASDHVPSYFTAADEYATQLQQPVFRYEAGQTLRALAVPLLEFCRTSAAIQCELGSAGMAEPQRHEWIVFFSTAVTATHLKQLIALFDRDKPREGILKFIAISGAWPSGQTDITTLVNYEYGKLTLKDGVTHEFSMWILEPPPSTLVESPISEQRVPEGSDYLRGREAWFREKFDQHN